MDEHEHGTQHIYPLTNGLAITSLVLGIVGLVSCTAPLTSVPGIICGHMGLSSVKRSAGRQTGAGLAIAGLVMGYVGLLVTVITILLMVVAIFLPAFASARERAEEVASVSNVRQICLACINYSTDSKGRLPDSLQDLVDAGLLDEDALQSPSSNDPDPDYELVLTGTLDAFDDPSKTVMVREIREGRGRIAVGYADGHVETIDPMDLP